MKSLEIFNRAVKESKGTNLIELANSEIQTIKQSLEVLEILRKKEVDIGFLKSILQDYSIEEALEIYNECERHLTMEELLKLKQWLEVNE